MTASDDIVPRTMEDWRKLTPARVALPRQGASLATDAVLQFALDHARARDAVHTAFDAPALMAALGALGLATCEVASLAADRSTFLRRPDLGRKLDPASRATLSELAGAPCDAVIVIGDGLSASAVHAHALETARRIIPSLAASGIEVRIAIVVRGLRVALGDEIGEVLRARLAIVLLGERPGLSTPDSLGAYLTLDPRSGRTDAERNCVSNIHAAGLSYDEAAFKIAWLAKAALSAGATGVALKDESGAAAALPSHTES